MTENGNTDKSKAFVFLNPIAGTSEHASVEERIRQVLTENQIPFHIHATSKGEDLHQCVKEALENDYQRFFALGGDGTVAGVASGLVDTSIPLTVIPTGTANVIARLLKIPFDKKNAFIWWLQPSQVKKMDAMCINDRYHFLTVSAGASSQELNNVTREEKQKMGSLAYWIHGFQRLLRVKPYRFAYSIDEKEFDTQGIEWIAINGGYQQVFPMNFEPKFQIDDGKLTVCQIKINNFGDYLQLAAGLIMGNPVDIPQTNCHDAYHTINLSSEPSVPVQADGELIGTTPVSITLRPQAVGFLAPVYK
jgi:YegS/Rv2252/BmrU family lipid kinase